MGETNQNCVSMRFIQLSENLFEFLFCEKTKDTFLLIWFIFNLNGPTQLYFAFTGKSYDNHMQIEIEFRSS